jgi:sulfofructosephosphate aldolase
MPDLTGTRTPADLSRLALPTGAFAMLAIDQRVSLETMFEDAGRPVDPEAMDAFRADVLSVLGPEASAVLVERGIVERGRFPDMGAPPPGRILAGDRLAQSRGHAATSSSLDPDGPAIARELGAHAMKLMAIHTLGTPLEPVLALIAVFVATAHGAGLPAVVEGIVRGPDGVPADAFVAATAAMAAGADLYKAQTPIFAGSEAASITALARDISAALACPWVVLSTGVDEEAFPAAVAAACRGGASGFLAGRGIWGSALTAADPGAALRGPARARLVELRTIVAAEARPWQDVAGDDRRRRHR